MANQGALICGFYGYSNTGDEAMLSGMVKLLRQQDSNYPLTVLTFNPEDTERRHRVSTVPTHPPRRRLDVLKRKLQDPEWQAMKQNPVFVLGGGDLLRDGADRPVAEFWLWPLQKALKLKRRTAILGVSVGEIWKPETEKLIPWVLNQVDLITVRDAVSKQKLEALGVTNPVHVIPDLALQAVQSLQGLERPSPAPERPLQVGISVRWMSNRGQTVDYDYGALQREIAAIADYAAEHHNAVVHFLPFQAFDNYYANDDDDYIAILEMLRHSRCSPDFVVHRYFPSLAKLTQVMAGLDVVVGMRLHSLIVAAGLEVPMIAAEYDPKVAGFMAEIGQSDYSVPLGEFNRDRIIPLLDQLLADPKHSQRAIAQGLEHYQSQLQTVQPLIQTLLQAK